jgi:hypothetical protein
MTCSYPQVTSLITEQYSYPACHARPGRSPNASMTPETQKLLDLLESELGYSERGGAYTKFGDWYGKHIEFDADYSSAPWCDMFLSWAAYKLGYQEWVGQFAYTVAHAEWFKEQGAWGTKPKPGALVFYDWSGSNKIDNIDHVGIVTKVTGNTIHTIEGNIDGGVAKRKERDQSKVVGYGYPEVVKKHLEERKIEVREPGSPGGTEADRLQLPVQPPGIGELLPESRTEEPAPAAQGPLAPRPSQKTAAKPSPATPEPAAEVAAGSARQTAKPGKHAKPATADTEGIVREPVHAFKDASSTSPLPSLGSPGLIGPVLLAALGVLAVAKTKQMRVRLSPAVASTGPAFSAAAPGTRRPGRRRAPRGRRRTNLTVPPSLPLSLPLSAPATTTPLAAPASTPPMTTPATTAPAVTAPATTLPLAALPLTTLTTARDTTLLGPVPAASPAPESTLAAAVGPLPGAGQSVTAGFDAFEPPARGAAHPDRQGSAAYRGRRRLREHAVEETSTFRPDAAPRGRRHRVQDTTQRGVRAGRATSTAQPDPSFPQDGPLRGRRHRRAVDPTPAMPARSGSRHDVLDLVPSGRHRG